jgi:hypothetical protein
MFPECSLVVYRVELVDEPPEVVAGILERYAKLARGELQVIRVMLLKWI